MRGTWYTDSYTLYYGNKLEVVKMLRSKGSQGQFFLRKALTVATTGGHGYMQRCHDNMRSELPKYDGNIVEILSSSFIHACPLA